MQNQNHLPLTIVVDAEAAINRMVINAIIDPSITCIFTSTNELAQEIARRIGNERDCRILTTNEVQSSKTLTFEYQGSVAVPKDR